MVTASPPRATRLRHVCSDCGAVSAKWQGRCDGCGAWNTLTEDRAAPRPVRGRPVAGTQVATLHRLDAVDSGLTRRVATGIAEVDRVLGGGIVPGSLVLLGGDPGIGKSTLALDLARRCGAPGSPTLYCAGEESPAQLSIRALRTGCAGSQIAVVAETDLDAVLATIAHHRPQLAVVDSVQTLHDPAAPGAPGSVSQVREAVSRLLLCAKACGTAILLIGHVTKEGAIAGPRTLEHMVDVVLYLEGERHGDHRLLRGVKNRFGATDELGILVLDDSGIHEALAPGRAFVDSATLGVPGNVLTVTCEGSRPLAVEVQALVVKSSFPVSRRTASGFDLGRLHVLIAVLEKRGEVLLKEQDVYVNAVGGVHLGEPAADLAVAMAIASAYRNRSLPAGLVAVGEIGLSGEVRRVRRLEARLAEAAALGFDSALVPAAESRPFETAGLRLARAGTIADALTLLA